MFFFSKKQKVFVINLLNRKTKCVWKGKWQVRLVGEGNLNFNLDELENRIILEYMDAVLR
jgi:hypothetical protein